MFAQLRSISLLLLLLAAGQGWAADVTIHASNFVFTPANVTINVGDTVTFVNDGGFHNVVSNDGGFRCANGCDGQGGNGAPASGWQFSMQFTSAGTFHYVCEVHAAMGMVGSITVNAAPPPPPPPSIKLGGYLSGNWFNPAQGGHGFQLEFTNQADSGIPTQKELVAIWFVYTPDGSGQNWIYAQGPFDSTKNTVTVPATIFHGTKFPFPLSNFDPNALQGNLGDWGSVTFTFSDCNNGTASWTSTVNGYGNGTFPIQRLTSIQGTACPQ